MTVIIICSIGALLLLVTVFYFNRFTRYKNRVKNAWSDIDVQLKRRYSLVPNIVETVKGYSAYERSVLENITNSRSLALQAKNVTDLSNAENMLTGALKGLFIMVENYPELLANQNFLKLQETLIDIEENLQMARRYYNAIVRDNNTAVESFPGNLFAKIFGFTSKEFFEIEALERQNIKVGN